MLALAALVALTSARTQSADDIMRAAAARLASAQAVEAQFTVNGGDGPVQGSIVLSGPRFAMSTPLLDVWYDGTTQWTMLHSTSEVSITEPTAEELMESNPFAILRNYGTLYHARRLSDVSGRRRVELTPIRPTDAEIERAIILVDAEDWPAAAEIHFRGNRVISATIDRIGATTARPASTFRFDPARHPATEIIDLR